MNYEISTCIIDQLQILQTFVQYVNIHKEGNDNIV